ncbi:MAG: transaldolase family protein [Phormidesmis sp.]
MILSPNLRLYLDTADTAEWQTWLPTGLFYGVTCNPLLLEKAGVSCDVKTLRALTQQALRWGIQEVHLQAWGDSAASLVSVGQQLGGINRRVFVKLPATQAGTTAAKALIQRGIPVTLTAVYAVHQVLIAAAIGASYVAPYLGRINDAGRDGRQALVAMQRSLTGVSSQTRILLASIREIEDISALAQAGVNTFTFSSAIAQAFFDVPETLNATADFERAAKKMMP